MLSIRSLGKRYPGGTVGLSDFSLEVGEGVLGLLGPNGAGKTTLMSILATVTKATSGSFFWEGKDAARDPLPLRRQLGYLPQDFGVYEKLTAREFLLYLGRLKGLSGADLDRRVKELLELTNLHGAADRRLGGYSGGMRQRVGIAQALLGDPKLVIVDEPTVGLDPGGARALPQPALRDRAGPRRHPLDAHRLGRRGGRLRDRRDAPGPPRRPRDARVAAAESLGPRLHRGRRLRAPRRDAEDRPRLQPHSPRATACTCATCANGNGAALPGARSVEPDLEDAYLLTNIEAA